ncbi:kinase [Novosphingobium sp. MBES04]|uniref:kinase n=1 Tax=Novosphingobium sp. MBES04 TaxID=1206458 RepID=UPI00057F8D61|nr:kinase [Novosphingobium sp. MBES04]GAM04012.1 hypothetical conserved protein [Novosphingobium sp. MBES04]
MAKTIADLMAAERLPATYTQIVDRWWRPLARRIGDWHAEAGRPLIVGVNGAQGSGKSTLCRFLAEALLPECGLAAVTLSLDDFYLTRAERVAMARDIHPLFRTRGVPGTHDVALALSVMDDLVAGRDTAIPRFSKALDDRLPVSDRTRYAAPVHIVLLEGWCIGATPQLPADLAKPLNELEAQEDADGIWRSHANALLEASYAQWFSRIDRLIMLKPPSFDHVLSNRLLQEEKLRRSSPDAPAVMDEPAVRRFISHYERLTRHMFAEMPQRADMVFDLDSTQNVVASQP